MYSIKVDKPNDVIEVRLSGMMSPDEIASYIDELKRLFVGNKLRSYAMVIDVSECPIQSQDTIQALVQHMATMPKARALALVTGSSLARMQVRRVIKQPYARITANVEDGRAWVIHGTEPSTT